MIDSHTSLNLVIGDPIGHSWSPILHQSLYEKLKINAVMLAKSGQSLEHLVTGIRALSVGLTAVTAPYKKRMMPYLDVLSQEAVEIGAVNTVIQRHGRLYGYNTDVDGILFALRQQPLWGKVALVIGAGGAAAAMGYVLQRQGAEILWTNRTMDNLSALMTRFGGAVYQSSSREPDVIINATPVGLYPNMAVSPIEKNVFREGQIVFDMIYHPSETLFLKQAKACGALTISGLDMLVGQAVKQIDLWQMFARGEG